MDFHWLSFEGFHHLSMMELVMDVFFLHVQVQPFQWFWVVAEFLLFLWVLLLLFLLSSLVSSCRRISWALNWRCLDHNCTIVETCLLKTIPMSDLFCRMVSHGEYIHSTHNPSTMQNLRLQPLPQTQLQEFYSSRTWMLRGSWNLYWLDHVGPFEQFFLCYFPETWHDNGKATMNDDIFPIGHGDFTMSFLFLLGVYLLWTFWQGCSIAVYFEWFAQNIVLTESRVYIYIDIIIHISHKCWYVFHWLDIHSASTRHHFMCIYIYMFIIYMYIYTSYLCKRRHPLLHFFSRENPCQKWTQESAAAWFDIRSCCRSCTSLGEIATVQICKVDGSMAGSQPPTSSQHFC